MMVKSIGTDLCNLMREEADALMYKPIREQKIHLENLEALIRVARLNLE